MRTYTKIICTIGPAVLSVEKLMQLITDGMDVARINFSHGTHEQHRESIAMLKEARERAKAPLGIMLDTKGPEIRVGQVQEGGVKVVPGQRLALVGEPIVGSQEALSIRPACVLDFLEIGTHVLIDNGYIQAEVVERSPGKVVIEFFNEGTVLASKGVNIPGVHMPLQTPTDRDIEDIEFGCEAGIELIAASFVRTADNVLEIKRLLSKFKRPEVQVLAKIESTDGVRNFDSILQVADGIMVARGDLGVEVPLCQVPRLQKMMIRKCNIVGKPVVIATQMLESMMRNPRPTRAEVSDVANAIYDGTSAVMLSGETAAGQYPHEALRTMGSIVAEAEQDFDYTSFFESHAKLTYHDHGIPPALTLASVKTAYSLDAKAIFTFSCSGATARLLSRLKPKMPVIALTTDPRTYNQLALLWGIRPILCDRTCASLEDAFQYASQVGLDLGIVKYGDLVVLAAGSPFWVPGTSNTIVVDSIGDVLVRGERGFGERVHGIVVLAPESFAAKPCALRGCILVLSSYDDGMDCLIHEAAGVIFRGANEGGAVEERLIAACRRESKTLITGLDGSCPILKEKQLVTLEPRKALVYKGLIR